MDVDRLKARAYALPTTALGDVPELKLPIGELHPLRIAEAVARFGGRPADAASVAQHDEAVLAVLDPTPARSRARTRRRTRRCASRGGCCNG